MSKTSTSRIISVVLALAFIAGLFLLLYPTVSNLVRTSQMGSAINAYRENLDDVSLEEYQQLIDDARAYNERLVGGRANYVEGEPQDDEYSSLLNTDDSGMMGYITIDKIDVQLPIYHGTSDTVLSTGVGHLEGSSLPVGGKGTHAVLTGHRGLPSARLFTDLDQLEVGDTFVLNIMNETLTYEVDQVRIVDPDELDDIQVVPGEDLCTLVTCTPYGVNTQRLLVRGHRVPNAQELNVTPDATQVDPLIVASVLAAGMLAVAFVVVLVRTRKKN